MLKISVPELVEDKGLIRYSVDVVSEHMGTSRLYYEVDKAYADMVSDASDAALAGLLIPAMFYGEDIFLEGKVSEKLYFNVSYRLQKLLQTIMPFLKQVHIHAEKLISDDEQSNQGSECAVGFSGGIDSFATLADYFYHPKCPESSKITMLTYNNVGSHGSKEKGYELFLKRYHKLQRLAEKIGLPFIKINSNLDDFYQDKKLDFQQTHTVRNASVGLLLQSGIHRFVYSSAYAYKDVKFGENNEMASSDIATLPMLSTENLAIESIGSEYDRVKKTEIVSTIEDSYEFLDVCTRDKKDVTNCSACAKCLGAQFTLELMDKLDLYHKSFDLKIYQKHRTRFLGRVLAQNYVTAKLMYRFARQKNLSFPLLSYLYYVYYELRYWINKK